MAAQLRIHQKRTGGGGRRSRFSSFLRDVARPTTRRESPARRLGRSVDRHGAIHRIRAGSAPRFLKRAKMADRLVRGPAFPTKAICGATSLLDSPADPELPARVLITRSLRPGDHLVEAR
jgi:hypothetical protein